MKNWGLDDFALGDLVWAQVIEISSGTFLSVGLATVKGIYTSKWTASRIHLQFFDGDERLAYPGEDFIRKATKLDKLLEGYED